MTEYQVNITNGTPPSGGVYLDRALAQVEKFAGENNISLPVDVRWLDDGETIRLLGEHEGRVFAIGYVKVH